MKQIFTIVSKVLCLSGCHVFLQNYLKISFVLLMLFSAPVFSQTYKFAELAGSPVMNTTGWNLVGDARVGSTGADGNNLSDELILCSPVNSTSGACFYSRPVNISQCQKWTAEFDYRIFDGTGADGIAFCFLANPPTGFTTGGNVGIPNRPIGLMIILDTYLNCPGSTSVPKLEMRYYEGNVNFGGSTEALLECPVPVQPTSGTLPILRQSSYNRMKITYSFGEVKVFINNTQVLSGNYKINFPGYFGFTSSTGGSNDRHSIKNFVLYTFKPIVSPPNAGQDITVCNGDSVQLGVSTQINDPYTYDWNPKTNISNPKISNPKVRVFNNSPQPVTYTYFVTKDSLINDTLCAYSDDIKITVRGKAAQAGADQTLCSGKAYRIFGATQAGVKYKWTPATGLNDATLGEPTVQITNKTNAPVVYQYIVEAILNDGSCPASYDTVQFTILPEFATPSKSVSMCSGESRQIGVSPATGTLYNWSPATGLSKFDVSNPVLTLTNSTLTVQTYKYILTSYTSLCTTYDTVVVTLVPKTEVIGSVSVCPNVTGVLYEVKNPVAGLVYNWTVTGGTLKSGQGTGKIVVDWGTGNSSASVSVNISGQNCPASLPVTINKLLSPQKPVTADPRLCLATAKNVRFETLNTTGSVYTWFVSGNGKIVSGQGTNVILADWNGEGVGKVWVQENSTTQTDVCQGVSDTLFLQINQKPDPESVIIRSVTIVPDKDSTALLRFVIKPNPDLKSTFVISRRTFLPSVGNWTEVGTVAKTDSLFTDKNLNTSANSFEYKIEGKDRCDLPVVTNPNHHTVVLKAEADNKDSVITLSWNDYTGWRNGVKSYEIWRKLDDKPFNVFAIVSGNTLTYRKNAAYDGFQHTFQIMALEDKGNTGTSFSNRVKLEFEHPLVIPNLITPGNDDKNEFWVIGNLQLYPHNELVIFNRLGKEVFKTSDYKQNWNADKLPNGIYYYLLETAGPARKYQGWIMVMRGIQ
jgi:gliding motility-associated-like protein